MNTAILLVAHEGLGEAFCRQAEVIIGHPPAVTLAAVRYDSDPSRSEANLLRAMQKADAGDGVVVLTDLPGATPHNLAVRAAGRIGAPVIAGLNLPMLLKALNHAHLAPDALARKAAEGGRQGITGP